MPKHFGIGHLKNFDIIISNIFCNPILIIK